MFDKTKLPQSLSFTYETDRLILKVLTPEYRYKVRDFLYQNRFVFEKYEPSVPENYYTPDFQLALLKYEFQLALKLSTVRFYVFLKEDPDTIIGTVCLHNIIKMPYFSSEIGYKFDNHYWHHGYAGEALSFVISLGFDNLGLHKIFARCMPDNTPSRKLLLSIGFSEEGLEHDCTLIQGKWQDHIRYAIINHSSNK